MDRRYFMKLSAATGLATCASKLVGEDLEGYMAELINRERRKHNLTYLYSDDPRLFDAARSHSYDMMQRNQLSHHSPDPEKRNHRMRIKNQGITDIIASGENVGRGAGKEINKLIVKESMYGCNKHLLGQGRDINITIIGFMESQEHKENILRPNYNYFGAGITKDYRDERMEKIWITQLFLERKINIENIAASESNQKYDITLEGKNLTDKIVKIDTGVESAELGECDKFTCTFDLKKNSGKHEIRIGIKDGRSFTTTNEFYVNTNLPLHKIIQYK